MWCLICSTHKWNYSYSHMLSGAACWRYSVGLPKYLLFYMKFGMKLNVNPVQCLLQTRCPATVMEVCLERQRCSWDRYGNLSAWHTHTHTTSVCNKINLKAKIEIYCKVTVLAGTVQVLMCVCVCPGVVHCLTQASWGGCCRRRCSTAWTTSSRSSKLWSASLSAPPSSLSSTGRRLSPTRVNLRHHTCRL